MSLEDYLLDLVLVAAVLHQLRGRSLTARGLLWPLPLVVAAAVEYLSGFPTTDADWLVVLACASTGTLFGGLAAKLTRIRRQEDGALFAVATAPAAILWVLGVGARVCFGMFATHGGGPLVARFSTAHDITTATTWTTALLLMSLCEVLCRALTLGVRGHRALVDQNPVES